MIICYTIGGIGNQMFIYAFGAAVSAKYNKELKFDITDFNHKKYKNFNIEGFVLDKIFDIKIVKANFFDFFKIFGFGYPLLKMKYKISLNNFFKNVIPEKQLFKYDQDLLNLKNENIYFYGWWQNYIFPMLEEKQLRKSFTFNLNNINDYSIKLAKKIQKQNSVSIQVRLGDYLDNKETNSIYGICNKKYYIKSIDKISKLVKNPVFYVFSDQPEKLSSYKIFDDFNIVNVNVNENSWNDMYLMSKCKYNIIANSTFGWWGAWLNNYNKKIVIAPKNWFANGTKTPDLIPKSWLKL